MLDIKQYRIARHHSDNMELISQKGENHKSHNGLIYRFGRIQTNAEDSWRYVKKNCLGRIHVMNSNIEITGNHDHVPNPAKIGMKQSLTEVR